MLMNGDGTIHTSRLWSVGAFITGTNLQGFIYFLSNAKTRSKLSMLSGHLNPMIPLVQEVWVVGTSTSSCRPLPSVHPAILSNLRMIPEIYIFELVFKMDTG